MVAEGGCTVAGTQQFVYEWTAVEKGGPSLEVCDGFVSVGRWCICIFLSICSFIHLSYCLILVTLLLL